MASDHTAAHAFLDAAKAGDWHRVNQLTRPELVNAMPCGRWAALHQAALFGDTDAIRNLVKCRADVRLRNRDGCTALEIARERGHPEAEQLLQQLREQQFLQQLREPHPAEQVLALAMALHPRLGAGSAASVLPSSILPKVHAFLPLPAPVLQCSTCLFRLVGFSCQGSRTASLRTAGATLPVVPSGCGRLTVSCHNAPMLPAGALEPSVLDESLPGSVDRLDAGSRALLVTCSECGWSVDGARCATGHGPLLLPRNGFFERVWCAYVWSCARGCGRSGGGGTFHGGSCRCACGGRMKMLDYLERNGPPRN